MVTGEGEEIRKDELRREEGEETRKGEKRLREKRG